MRGAAVRYSSAADYNRTAAFHHDDHPGERVGGHSVCGFGAGHGRHTALRVRCGQRFSTGRLEPGFGWDHQWNAYGPRFGDVYGTGDGCGSQSAGTGHKVVHDHSSGKPADDHDHCAGEWRHRNCLQWIGCGHGRSAALHVLDQLGALPGGLALAPDGTISGTPTAIGDFNVTIQVTDKQMFTDSKSLPLKIVAPPSITTNSPLGIQVVGTASQLTLAATGERCRSRGQ